jgi:hypothetical protein
MGEKYLPIPSGLNHLDEVTKYKIYNAYKNRAIYHNYVKKTVDNLSGLF